MKESNMRTTSLLFDFVGGTFILLNGAFSLPINMPMQIYAMAFPFLAIDAIHLFLSMLSIAMGAVIVALTLVFFLQKRKQSINFSLVLLSLAIISFLSGGGFIVGAIILIIVNAWPVVGRFTFQSIRLRQNRVSKPVSNAQKPLHLNLSADEKTMWSLINKNNGTTLQSKLIVESGFSKVKTTRVLNKLEARGLIERRRIGMSNVIIRK
ncbi:hypothetical protein M1585_02765 [Candidatus Parvarchaeota archaeon]|jgi:uncharacterized membrane protein|nr:hypothetical protein [Candidatus Parvarchaeota archaeon]